MRRKLSLFFAVALAALLVYACVAPPTVPNPNSNQTQTTNITIGGGLASPSPSPGACNPVARVGINVPESLKVGEYVTLDATAKDAGNNTRSDACNVATGVLWTAAGPCTLVSATSFTPRLRGDAAGQCAVSAVMAGVTSEVKSVRVVN